MTPGTARRVWLAWSSGKDSAFALHVLRQDPAVEVCGLLTTLDAAGVAMHRTPRALLQAQAAAVDLPLHAVELPQPCPNAEYERAMGAALARARQEGVQEVAFGDLFLADLRAWRERTMQPTGIGCAFPLWGRDTRALAREMLAAGLQARVTCGDTSKLPAAWAGRAFDAALLAELPHGGDPGGENGELPTFAHAGPMFARPVPHRVTGTVEAGGFCWAMLA